MLEKNIQSPGFNESLSPSLLKLKLGLFIVFKYIGSFKRGSKTVTGHCFLSIEAYTRLFLFIFGCLLACVESHALPSFPGAEGYGAIATGGRGGQVRKVTNLADTGAGSFRAAVSGDSAKIVVFEVSGIIRNNSVVEMGKNTTIAGQTSPKGIIFYNWNRDTSINNGLPLNDRIDDMASPNGGIIINSNTIVRHIRIRGSSYKS
ncbi:MAG: hypothetical protein ABIA63_14165, partial [bacterium]